MTAASAPLHILVRFGTTASFGTQGDQRRLSGRDQHYRDCCRSRSGVETADKAGALAVLTRSGHSPAVAIWMRWPSPGSASTIIPYSCRPWRAGAAPPIC